MASKRAAQSATLCAIGPAVSWECEIGTIPARETRPTVGLKPTMPQTVAGQTIEPSVSVPTATVAKEAPMAEPEPAEEPHGDRSRTWGLRHWPPRALQPERLEVERKLAHSDRLVLPRMTAPAARRPGSLSYS